MLLQMDAHIVICTCSGYIRYGILVANLRIVDINAINKKQIFSIYFAHFFVMVTGDNNNDEVNSSRTRHTYKITTQVNYINTSVCYIRVYYCKAPECSRT